MEDRRKVVRHLMYLETIILDHTLPCLAEPGKIIVIGRPSQALTEVIPYLAALPGVISYNPANSTLTFRRPRGFMTLYPDKVFITQVKDTEEGLELLQALAEAINATWEKRAELVPVQTARQSPKWLDIWEQLPRTNCKQCGEATCAAFAAAMQQGKRQLSECVPLASDPAFSERRAALQAMI